MFYFNSKKDITVYFSNGDIAIWDKNNPMFEKILQLCLNNEWIKIETLHNQAKIIMTSDNVKVTKEGNVLVNDMLLENTADPLLNMIKLLQDKGIIIDDIEKVKPFFRNMIENKHINAVEEIYQYCKAMDFEITEDGCFLAYKNVNKDFSSIYDKGKTKHAIGVITKVDKFDTNRHEICSYGLHFCSKTYLSFYTGDVTIIVKINPRDVCSIPIDYNFTKGRCTEYMMVGLMAKDGTLQTTNIKAATGEKIVKTKARVKADKKVAKITASNRIQETAEYMKIHKNDVSKVANVMNISTETVKRNMRKFRSKG